MRFFKLLFFVLAILLLQTVLFPRLPVFGAFPDLVMVCAVCATAASGSASALALVILLSFFQDLLSAGIYINTAGKLLLSALVIRVKERFLGDSRSLSLWLVLIGSPLLIGVEAGVHSLLYQSAFAFFPLLFRVVITTLYNLALTPLIYSWTEGVLHDSQE
jgi:hypothetical protein